MCIVTADHEAIGHGAACLSQGGHIERLTSVYFQCSVKTGIVAAGGPIGNLIGAFIAWLLLRFTPPQMSRLRLLLILIAAFAVFWEAGYLLKAMIDGDGDSYFAFRGLFGAPETWWRAVGIVLGLALYALGIRITLRSARDFPSHVLAFGWGVASVAAALATLAYAPAPFAAMHQATLEIGVASWPLPVLALRRMRSESIDSAHVSRGLAWIAGAAILYIVLVATLGRGIT